MKHKVRSWENVKRSHSQRSMQCFNYAAKSFRTSSPPRHSFAVHIQLAIMYAWTTRANNLGSFVTTVIFGICIATALSDFLFVPSHRVTAKVNKINNIVSHGKMDEAVGLEFALDADYRGVFSWNVKQLFIYVTVDYTTPLNGRNEVVIWDQIMEEHNDKIIKQRRIKPEYRLVDQARGLKGNQYNLTVHWNVMPWVGMLTTKKETFGPFEFPGGGAKESAESS